MLVTVESTDAKVVQVVPLSSERCRMNPVSLAELSFQESFTCRDETTDPRRLLGAFGTAPVSPDDIPLIFPPVEANVLADDASEAENAVPAMLEYAEVSEPLSACTR